MARLRAWVQASRPFAQIPVAGALIYGQALAFALHGTFHARIFVLVQLLGLLEVLLVVFANDAADAHVDATSRTRSRYSGSSGVVAERKLTPFELAQGALVALLLLGGVGAYLALHEQRAFMVVVVAITAHLAWMYGFPPFRLSFRGLGELTQGIGLGAVLPAAGFYAQANRITGLHPATLFPAVLLAYGGHILSSLMDTSNDRAADKRTFPVRRGERAARRTALALFAIAALATPLAAPAAGAATWLVIPAAGAVVVYRALPLVAVADSERRSECERFVACVAGGSLLVLFAWSVALVASRAP